jgi:hypothetical protein
MREFLFEQFRKNETKEVFSAIYERRNIFSENKFVTISH